MSLGLIDSATQQQSDELPCFFLVILVKTRMCSLEIIHATMISLLKKKKKKGNICKDFSGAAGGFQKSNPIL